MVTGNENVKIVFCIDLRQTKTKMIYLLILRISLNTFHQRKCLVFVTFVFNYPGVPRVAAVSWPFTCLFERPFGSASVCFYRAMHFSAKRGIAITCRLSVRPSVCLSVCNVGEL